MVMFFLLNSDENTKKNLKTFPRAISVLTLGNKAILLYYYLLLYNAVAVEVTMYN